jgi:serine/threonine-protein kinase
MLASSKTALAPGDALFSADFSRRNRESVAESFAAKSQSLSASLLGPWQLQVAICEGAFTRLYRARHSAATNESACQYVLKVLRDEWREHPLAQGRLRNEAIVGKCVAHRHIVPILTAQLHRQPFYTVQPLLAGTTVAALLRGQHRLSLSPALWVARQAAEGLAALHLSGYLHGDVKPANFMLAANGHVTLIDLGCARRLPDEPTLPDRTLIGTPAFMAPELFTGRAPDSRSDLYSLGIALFEMLTGRTPFAVDNMEALSVLKREGRIPDVRIDSPQTPGEVADLVRALTSRDPLRRPHPAAEVVNRLLRLEIATLRHRLPA